MNQRSILQLVGIVVMAAGVSFLAFSWTTRSDGSTQDTVLTELTELTRDAVEPATIGPANSTAPASTDVDDETTLAADDATEDFPAIVDSAVRDPETNSIPVGVSIEVIEEIPHDTTAFTQGLEFDGARLFESTGLVGESTVREIDPDNGAVLRSLDVADVFAEGLTVVDDTAIQLTWRDNEAYRYDLDSFARLETYTYDGEGWGLCDDGEQLVMSDGSPTLQFRDRDTFELLSTIDVEFNNSPVEELNELECVNGRVWANIWQSPLIIEIDPASGKVTTVANARFLTPPSAEGSTSRVLNGIAYDERDGTFLLTGKQWPLMYRVRFVPLAQ